MINSGLHQVRSVRIIRFFLTIILLADILLTASCSKNPDAPSPGNQDPQKPIEITGTIWGASSAPFIGENLSGIASWQRLNIRLMGINGGFGMRGRRSYDVGIPVNFTSSAMVDDIGKCPVSIGSFKPVWTETINGNNNEAIKKFVQSIPGDRIVYLTFYHEPEDDMPALGTSDTFQQAFAKFATIVLSAGKPNVHPCFILMTWTFKPQSGRNPDNYNMTKYLKPEQLKGVIAGLDGYAEDPSSGAQQIFETGFSKMKSWGFSRFGIFETGAHASSDPAARSVWVNGLGQWVNSRKDIELVSWFNNGNGQHAGPTGWYLGNWYVNGTTYTWDDTDGTIAAYANLLKQ